MKAKAHQDYIEIEIDGIYSIIYVSTSKEVKLFKNKNLLEKFTVKEGYTVTEFISYVKRVKSSLNIEDKSTAKEQEISSTPGNNLEKAK